MLQFIGSQRLRHDRASEQQPSLPLILNEGQSNEATQDDTSCKKDLVTDMEISYRLNFVILIISIINFISKTEKIKN